MWILLPPNAPVGPPAGFPNWLEEIGKLAPKMWSLDSLAANEPIQKMIARDAADADVLIVAVSSLERREPKLIQWLDSLAVPNGSSRISGLFIGLLGDEASEARELDWTVKHFLRHAQRTDRDFIWHWMESEAMTDDGWLVDSVESLLARKCLAGDVPFLQETARGMT